MRVIDRHTLERVADYNLQYQRQHGKAPSFRQIMHGVGLGSLATVQRYIKVLENEGRLQTADSGRIEPMEQFRKTDEIMVPLIGEIACGEPMFAVENVEDSYALPKGLFGDGELFMLYAKGNSMVDAGISKGDIVVLRRQNAADDGEIVAALVDGEATLKRLFHKDGKIVLHPENKRMKDIVIDECEVQGILVGCIKRY